MVAKHLPCDCSCLEIERGRSAIGRPRRITDAKNKIGGGLTRQFFQRFSSFGDHTVGRLRRTHAGREPNGDVGHAGGVIRIPQHLVRSMQQSTGTAIADGRTGNSTERRWQSWVDRTSFIRSYGRVSPMIEPARVDCWGGRRGRTRR